MAAEHVGYGKLILFGEHIVVYRHPALVAAVAARTTCEVKKVDGTGKWTVIDDRPAVPEYKVTKKAEQDESTQLVLDYLKIPLDEASIEIRLGGDLTCTSGIGASAANCVALARALNELYSLGLTEEGINAAGYEGEKGYHGTPSGIDNTASTYGGVLSYQRTEGDPIFAPVDVAKGGVEIVYASTGMTASTSEVVGDVRKKKEADEAWFADLVKRYTAVYEAGKTALAAGDWKALGEQLDANHAICQEMTVSCKELDELVDTARAAGAIGAKMSGTGRGGLMVALTPGGETQDAVAKALEAKAPFVWKTKLFGAGDA